MLSLEILFLDNVKECRSLMAVKGTVMQTEKVLVNDCLHVSKVSWKFCIPIFFNFAVISPYTAQKMKFSIKDFFSKYDQIRTKLRFGHIYRRNPKLKTFFCAVLKFAIFLKSSLRFSQFLLSFLLIDKTLRFNYIKTRTALKAKFSVFTICVE